LLAVTVRRLLSWWALAIGVIAADSPSTDMRQRHLLLKWQWSISLPRMFCRW
jgi:hypothetical protein